MYSKYFKARTDEAQVYGVKGEAAEVGMIARRYIDMDSYRFRFVHIHIHRYTHMYTKIRDLSFIWYTIAEGESIVRFETEMTRGMQ